MTRPLFDLHVAIDWSAAGRPTRGADSIWCAVRTADRAIPPVNVPTRREAAAFVGELIESHPRHRILVGFDFPFGYPGGTASALGLTGVPWRSTWDLLVARVTDDVRNANNRFHVAADLNQRCGAAPGPFWGCPRQHPDPRLPATKPAPDGRHDEYRRCERDLRARGRRPSSVWQLCYAGSVGGQALVGIPVLAALLAGHPERVEVWPFTTGLGRDPVATRPDAVVLSEVWPSRFAGPHPAGVVKDAWQVARTASALAVVDRCGELGGWFDPPLPAAARASVEAEEGWILGPPLS